MVSVVPDQADAQEVLRVWDSVRTDPRVARVGLSLRIGMITVAGAQEAMPAASVPRISDPEQFSARTGIRVLPFSLILAEGKNVLAAGPGLPDSSLVLEAVEQFAREGPAATIRFRLLTLEMNAGLTAIETLFPSGAVSR